MKQEELIKKYWFIRYPIECHNGWLPLVDFMCKEIFKLIEIKYPKFKKGEYPFEFNSIKEKYGSLHCYPSFGNEEIFDVIEKYEEESRHVCEICGMKGEIREMNQWYKVLCDRCYSKKKMKEMRSKGADV